MVNVKPARINPSAQSIGYLFISLIVINVFLYDLSHRVISLFDFSLSKSLTRLFVILTGWAEDIQHQCTG